MAYFENERQMYIPLSVDEINVDKQGYFMSNKKVVEMVIAFIPYMVFMYFMLQIGSRVFPMLIFTLIYIFIFSFFFRFRILEENRLKKMLYELDNNRYSGADHFWGINKISDTKESNGLIHYEKNSIKNVRGYVVHFDRGSTVGVPQGNYTNYRKTKQDFLRTLGDRNYDFMWYEIPKRKETPKSMVYYFNVMANMKNKTHQKLLKLQIDMNTWFVKDSPELYVDFILVKCNRVSELQGFRSNLEDIISTTLDNNNYIINPRILGKKDVENFLADLFLIKSLDSSHIYKGQDSIPFESFGKIVRIVGQDEEEIDIESLNSYDFDSYSGKSLEDILEKDNVIKEKKLNAVELARERELKQLRNTRLRDKISDYDYKEGIKEINAKFDMKKENIESGEDLLEREKEIARLDQEKLDKAREKIERQEAIEREKLAPKYVAINENVNIVTTDKVVDNVEDELNRQYEEEHKYDYLEEELNLEDLLDDVELDDLKNDFSELPQIDNKLLESIEKELENKTQSEFENIEYDEDISLEDLLDFDEDDDYEKK